MNGCVLAMQTTKLRMTFLWPLITFTGWYLCIDVSPLNRIIWISTIQRTELCQFGKIYLENTVWISNKYSFNGNCSLTRVQNSAKWAHRLKLFHSNNMLFMYFKSYHSEIHWQFSLTLDSISLINTYQNTYTLFFLFKF